MNINYNSDFRILMRFDKYIPIYPWRIVFSTIPEGETSASGSYTVSFDGEEYTRAELVEGSATSIMVNFFDHGLTPGQLTYTMYVTYPDNKVPDDGYVSVRTYEPTIVLVDDEGDEGVVPPEVLSILSPILKPSPMAGLLAVLILANSDDVEITYQWINPSLGENACFNIWQSRALPTFDAFYRIVLENGRFATSADDYVVLGSVGQSSGISSDYGYLFIDNKSPAGFSAMSITPNGAVRNGAVLLVYSVADLCSL